MNTITVNKTKNKPSHRFFGARIPSEVLDRVKIASIKLGIEQQQFIEEALRQHLKRSGTEREVGR